MNDRTCNECLFANTCPYDCVCDGFYPVDGECDFDLLIERGREYFRNEWARYITWYDRECRGTGNLKHREFYF